MDRLGQASSPRKQREQGKQPNRRRCLATHRGGLNAYLGCVVRLRKTTATKCTLTYRVRMKFFAGASAALPAQRSRNTDLHHQLCTATACVRAPLRSASDCRSTLELNCTAVADHLLLETKGCAAVGRVIVMSSDSVEAWDAQEWVVIELQVRPWRPFHPHLFS